jgi:hypothetical protein
MDECKHRFGCVVPGVERCTLCGAYKDEIEPQKQKPETSKPSTSTQENPRVGR